MGSQGRNSRRSRGITHREMLLTSFSSGQVQLLFHHHQGLVPLVVVWAILQEQAIKKIPPGRQLKAILQLRSALLSVSS